MTWEAVIGLEIHTELNTKSKLFSSAPNRFGDEPNTNITEVCTGQPGALPSLNKEAIRKAILFGLAISAKHQPISRFDRKSYFYPDSPRNFQITQFFEPILMGGTVSAFVEGSMKTFTIEHTHLEDDAGMLKHFTDFAGVDYNRAGSPLLEIVSNPCIHSAKEAVAYGQALKSILEYIDVSDCNMEEGSLRMDVNISVRKQGESALRTKVEIKNMNSFSFMEKAIDAEIKRQIEAYEAHPDKDHKEVIAQSTYRWDPEKKKAVLMRRKEHSDDYRYCPEPDLPPIFITEAMIQEEREKLPELPLQRRIRYLDDLGLPEDTTTFLLSQKKLSDYFDQACKGSVNPISLLNWIVTEFSGRLKTPIYESGIKGEDVAELVNLVEEKKITGKIAKMIADEMVLQPGKSPAKIMEENKDLAPLDASFDLATLIDEVVLENSDSIQDYLAGKQKAFAFLVGQVMKKTKGKAPPETVNHLLKERIANKHS